MPNVCTLGDISQSIQPDVHGCCSCPHPMVSGPAISASGNVRVQGKPALRVGDNGVHCACCGPNTWVVTGGSGQVCINSQAAVRVGDATQHCGSRGRMKTGSGTVSDGSGGSSFSPFGPFGPYGPYGNRGLGPFGDGRTDAVCGDNWCPAALFCDLNACGTDVAIISVCGAAACGAAACGGAACGGAACYTAACGGEACGAAACAADAAAASACAVDIAPADACLADACAVNVVPVVPGI